MRTIRLHEDGHGLNDAIELTSDERDPKAGNGSHNYEARLEGRLVASIQFQHGPRHAQESTPGITTAVLLAILIDHLQGFQEGPLRNRENAIILTKLEECLLWTKARADERAKRGVLGTSDK